jgi:hypothetical protein
MMFRHGSDQLTSVRHFELGRVRILYTLLRLQQVAVPPSAGTVISTKHGLPSHGHWYWQPNMRTVT